MTTEKKLKIAINGFGRIGRAVAKINAEHNYFDLVLINDINPYVDNLAYLFKYDSTYGRYKGTVDHGSSEISINGVKIKCTDHRQLKDVPWLESEIDIVIDASGVDSNILDAKEIVANGLVKKVIVTHSNKDVDCEVIMGVNDDQLKPEHGVVSNSICDANAVSHIMKWIDDEYGIESGSLTTLHPWLSYQNLVDGPSISQANPGVVWTDFSLGRASTDSIIPKNTTAMDAIECVLPHLAGKVMSFSYRVPTDIVASSDIVLNIKREVAVDELKAFLSKQCLNSPYVRVNTESLVSLDYEQDESSGILDMAWVKTVGKTVKIILWYDNEWGYSARVLDLAKKLAKL